MRRDLERALASVRYGLDEDSHRPGRWARDALDVVERELREAYAALPDEVGAGLPLGEATTLAERVTLLDADRVAARLHADRVAAELASRQELSGPSGTMPSVSAPPAAGPAPRRDGHVPIAHPRGHHDADESARTCVFCEGGLFGCQRCGSFEGATTDMCPGEPMTAEQRDAVYDGELNYRLGDWRTECALIRMDHDTRRPGVQAALDTRIAELEREAADRAAGREVGGA